MIVRAIGVVSGALLLSSCAPGAPEGVDKAVLDAAIGKAVGAPRTCVLIAEDGEKVYRFGSNAACGQKLSACGDGLVRSADNLLQVALVDNTPMTASCASNAAGSRLVAWASGPIEGHNMVYAAKMEGDQIPPGIVIADKLKGAFAAAGL